MRPSVRSSARPYGTLFLGNRSLLFSEILYEVRVQKVRKNFPSAFLKNSHFGQKLSKIGLFGRKCPKIEVFRIFLAICSLEFVNFLVSRRLAEKRPKESRPFVRSSVRPFVRPSVRHAVSRKPFITFF